MESNMEKILQAAVVTLIVLTGVWASVASYLVTTNLYVEVQK